MSSYLLVIGERDALAWIIETSRMAFPPLRGSEVKSLRTGDQLFIVTTRKCFHSPAKDRTRVVGTATVCSEVTTLDDPVELVGRTFDHGCALRISTLAPYREGVELAPLIDSLDAFPTKHAWALTMRRPLVRLSARDAKRLSELVGSVAAPAQIHRDQYVQPRRVLAPPLDPDGQRPGRI